MQKVQSLNNYFLHILTWVHGYKDARIQGFKDIRIYKDARIQGYKNISNRSP